MNRMLQSCVLHLRTITKQLQIFRTWYMLSSPLVWSISVPINQASAKSQSSTFIHNASAAPAAVAVGLSTNSRKREHITRILASLDSNTASQELILPIAFKAPHACPTSPESCRATSDPLAEIMGFVQKSWKARSVPYLGIPCPNISGWKSQ